jgi:hypothetical protein
MMKAPIDAELDEMIQAAIKAIQEDSGGEFDEQGKAFFTAGFKLGVVAMVERDVFSKMPRKTPGRAN